MNNNIIIPKFNPLVSIQNKRDYFDLHPALDKRMYIRLLNWLMAVSDFLYLQRQTYYLSIDILDRYLAASLDIPKEKLELVGVTCLFIATKYEEEYPPHLLDFSILTANSCLAPEIIDKEAEILATLRWHIVSSTPVHFLNYYLQVDAFNCAAAATTSQTPQKKVDGDDLKCYETQAIPLLASNDFFCVRYSRLEFIQAARLLDLCTFDMSDFRPELMAATVLCFIISPKFAIRASGISMRDMRPCFEWMAPFALTVYRLDPLLELNTFPPCVPLYDRHLIQTHSVNLETWNSLQDIGEREVEIFKMKVLTHEMNNVL